MVDGRHGLSGEIVTLHVELEHKVGDVLVMIPHQQTVGIIALEKNMITYHVRLRHVQVLKYLYNYGLNKKEYGTRMKILLLFCLNLLL